MTHSSSLERPCAGARSTLDQIARHQLPRLII
jgi:hypothetical protein